MILNSQQGVTGYNLWTVSELTAYIREMFEIDYRLQEISVRGEISNFARARSGHVYFTLKDEHAQLKCVMWRDATRRLNFRPEDGDAVEAGGRISVYEAGGAYQLYVETLERAGRGDLALAFERLKEKLASEGLFDEAYKISIPSFPRRIGIVTSADAAALQDILKVLQRRWPLVSVLVAPSLVQGPDAPNQIVRALQWLDGRDDIDTIIVARGGGSMEDLWSFNDEMVARAIHAAQHPIIVGVGHETDFTIADFVADMRAATPSVAAELAVPNRAEIGALLESLRRSLSAAMNETIERHNERIDNLSRAMQHLSPKSDLDGKRQLVDSLSGRLDLVMSSLLERSATRVAVAKAGLDAVSPQATLSRGYSIVRHRRGSVVRSVRETKSGDNLTVRVIDGEFDVLVE